MIAIIPYPFLISPLGMDSIDSIDACLSETVRYFSSFCINHFRGSHTPVSRAVLPYFRQEIVNFKGLPASVPRDVERSMNSTPTFDFDFEGHYLSCRLW